MEHAPPRRWEYLVLRLPHDRQRGERVAEEQVYHVEQDERILNALGAEGWEAVAAAPAPTTHDLAVLLKRPMP
jgi:hypothetical protein